MLCIPAVLSLPASMSVKGIMGLLPVCPHRDAVYHVVPLTSNFL